MFWRIHYETGKLPLNICKRHCLDSFILNLDKVSYPFDLSPSQLCKLMDWSLNYSFLNYKNKHYFQHKGIQMGNNASVPLANITVHEELKPLLAGKPEIIFHARLQDDIFLIVDTDNIPDFKDWIENVFTHTFLDFTFDFNSKIINFLDVSISLDSDNIINTTLFKKPMCKQQYLPFNSNHPSHIFKSLPYSQGLRVIRICSLEDDRNIKLNELFLEVAKCGYPESILNQCNVKLRAIDRKTALTPKTNLLMSNLKIHNSFILSIFNIDPDSITCNMSSNNLKVIYLTLPFYKCIPNMGRIIIETILEKANDCVNLPLKNYVMSMNFKIAFFISNSLRQIIR